MLIRRSKWVWEGGRGGEDRKEWEGGRGGEDGKEWEIEAILETLKKKIKRRKRVVSTNLGRKRENIIWM